MPKSGKLRGFDRGVLHRAGIFRGSGDIVRISSDRVLSPVMGRQARHDGIGMCMLRRGGRVAVSGQDVNRVVRNRRLLFLLWALTLTLWYLGWGYL